MMMTVVGVFVLSLFLLYHDGKLLTKNLVAPIEQMAENLSEPGTQAAYKELVPFMNKIRQQHEDILKSSQVRQEFTANVSHELKTPLTAISGYAELIEHGMSGENTERFASEIHKNAARLLTLTTISSSFPSLTAERKMWSIEIWICFRWRENVWTCSR